MHATLHALHQRGMLVVDEDDKCDPHLVATVETSWKDARLIGRPTDETLTAILTAGRLGMDLVTEDTDVHRLAGHWQVPTMTVWTSRPPWPPRAVGNLPARVRMTVSDVVARAEAGKSRGLQTVITRSRVSQ